MLPFNSYRAYGPPIDGGDGPRLPSLFIIVEAIVSPASTIRGGPCNGRHYTLGGDRTRNLQIRNLILYPIELQAF
jgi:hypothetical protein